MSGGQGSPPPPRVPVALILALVALAAGIAAVVLTIELVRTALA